jgi:DNA-binding beta-propeller fold protein YncE
MKARCASVVVLLVALLALVSAAGAGSPPHYKVTKTIVLGGEGFWDYLTYDPASHRLFITRGTHVMVVDESGKPAGDIPDTSGVHGVALDQGGHGFTSNGREATSTMFDLKTLKVLDKVKTDEGPDAIVYDPASGRVFTMNGRASTATAIDAKDGKVAGSIPLGGRPEFAVADGKGHLFANIEDKSELVMIDTRKLEVKSRWSLAPCEEPSGLAIDVEHHRLFSGCRNKMMAVVDAESGKVVATVPIGQGVDANRFDPATQLAFSSNGDGTLTVVHEESPDKYTVVENVETARGARTMELDPATHTIYLVTADFGPPPAATAENPRPRPTMVPGSFKLLVVQPGK